MLIGAKIEDNLQKSLETMAIENGKQIGQFVVDIIDDYVDRRFADYNESRQFARLSEVSFSEWDNEEDAIYDKL